jgi:actin-related protein 6
VLPNCIMKAKSEKRRAFVGDQIEDCRDLSSLFYVLPFQKGYLVNWDHQKTVWDHLFGKQCFNLQPEQLRFIVTEPYFNFASIQEGLSEIFFEEYGFKSLLRTHTGRPVHKYPIRV